MKSIDTTCWASWDKSSFEVGVNGSAHYLFLSVLTEFLCMFWQTLVLGWEEWLFTCTIFWCPLLEFLISNTGYQREGVTWGRKKQLFAHHSFLRVPTGFLVITLKIWYSCIQLVPTGCIHIKSSTNLLQSNKNCCTHFSFLCVLAAVLIVK